MSSRKMFCRLCLNIISEGNFTVMEETIQEVLGVLLLKLSVEENIKPVMCHDCSTKLFAAFRFKAVCTDTEDSIFPYVNSKNGPPVNLKEIYLKERGKEHLGTLLENERICRLCMEIIICGFTSVNDVKFDMFRKYIPEVNFNSTKDPVICTVCLDSLNNHANFLKNCVDTEEQIKLFHDNEDNQFSINTEEIDIKSEENNEDTGVSFCDAGNAKRMHGTKSQQSKHNLDTQMYRCCTCNYETNVKSYLVRHQLKHKKPSETQMYKCDKCDFKTKYKGHFTNHQLRHKPVSELQMYNCDICDFKTKYKNSLSLHRLRHKDPSEVQMYKCHVCGHETMYKGSLLHHVLIHKNISEVQMYNCDMCDYKTRKKGNLLRHQLRHKNISEVQMYNCDICDYKTKHKPNFLRHQLIHKDISEMQTYNCDICNFKTKQKIGLSRHQLTHKNISEMQMYNCQMCDYKSRLKGNLSHHILLHKDISKVQIYKCHVCDYRTREKGNLVRHQLLHKDTSEVPIYKCATCDYTTKYKANLPKHQLKHKSKYNRSVVRRLQKRRYISKVQMQKNVNNRSATTNSSTKN